MSAACLNCGTGLAGPFCGSCGQKARQPDPTFTEFVRETTQDLVNWDGRIPSTIKTLFAKPGALTLDFLRGRRVRWLPPLRVYLICSVAYFVSVPLVESVTGGQSRQMVRVGVTMTPGVELSPEDRAELDSSM